MDSILMEVENKYMNNIVTSKEEEMAVLPGFRFHPTDEELVGFYLRRKVEKRPINIELIKQIDIYKYEPWDLPETSNMGDKEWYFICKRGRKYRNSIRPNRVTGSGFWKATGIDRPIYNSTARHECIGLKKSLVYYRGSAGKGTKTDWMMHEFRLPVENDKSIKHIEAKSIAQEAEVWTLCRIFKRNGSYRKCLPEWRVTSNPMHKTSRIDTVSEKVSAAKGNPVDSSSQTCSADYISFGAPAIVKNNNNTPQQLLMGKSVCAQAPSSSFGQTLVLDMNELLKNGDYWDELRSVLEVPIDPFF